MRKVTLLYFVLILSLAILWLMGCGDESEEAVKKKDGKGPSIYSINPKNGAKDVSTTTSIFITFNKDIATPSAANLTFTPGVNGTASYNPDTRILIFKPSAELNKHTNYSLNIDGITDLEGNAMSPVTISFTTSVADITAPKIIFTSPENGQRDVGPDTKFVIRFSEPVDRTRLRKSISFDPGIDVSPDKWGIEWGTGVEEEVTIYLPAGSDPFDVNKDYTLRISRVGVVDASGNPMVADFNLRFRTLGYPVEKIGNLDIPSAVIQPLWMYTIGRTGNKWVVAWGGTQPKGAPSQNRPNGTITASADGQIHENVEAVASNASNAFTPTVTEGNGNGLTFQTVNLNNNRTFRIVFSSTSSYLTFDLRSQAGTIPAQYIHIGRDMAHPSRAPFVMKNR